MHSVKLRAMINRSIYLLVLFFPNLIAMPENFQTACELLKLPRDCHCQRTRGVPISSLNETRLRCRQLTEITTNHRWSIVPYDRLAFETPNDNLTLYPFAFADIRARTVRFDVQNLFLTDHTLDNAYIGQLAIAHTDGYGRINFEVNGQIFYGTTITNIFLKAVDFQQRISEIIFSNARVYSFIIQSSKFYGFTNRKFTIAEQNETTLKNDVEHDNFLEYDFMLTTSSSYAISSSPSSPLKIRRKKKKKLPRHVFETSDESSSRIPEQTIKINITAVNLPAFFNIYTILASINTSLLTEHYFPNNIDYSQTDEIELSYNFIHSIGAHAFRHLQFFEGRLILRHNQIQRIDPFAFADLHSVNNLSLANNRIQQLTKELFEHFNHLAELDLSGNQIQQLNGPVFQSLTNLNVLKLNKNPLKHIDGDLFTDLTQLKEIHLQGVDLFGSIGEQSLAWIWSLANVHAKHLLRTNFDLSDVAFCLLSRFNHTFYHYSRQHTCPCNIHYLYHPTALNGNASNSTVKYLTNYLRLSPVCLDNDTTSSLAFQSHQNDSEPIQDVNRTEFLLRGLEEQCDYRFIFLDCDAMTTTTEMTTTFEITSPPETSIATTTPRPHKYPKPPKKSVNNMKKLFTVLGTLLAITLAAIILVILWYRMKTVFKRRQKQKKMLEQQARLTLSPSNNNNNQHLSTAPRYASADMLSSAVQSAPLTDNKSQSQALIASAMPTPTVYKNIDAIADDSIQNLTTTDEANASHQTNLNDPRTTEIEAITPC